MGRKSGLRRWTAAVAETLFPPQCLCCGVNSEQVQDNICPSCLQDIPTIAGPLCTACGRSFHHHHSLSHLCGRCLRTPPAYTVARAVTYYEEPTRTLLHRLKYGYDTAAIPPLLKIARNFDISLFESCDKVVPVPLHRKKLKRRGMNQALILSRCLFPHRRKDILVDLLVKKRETPSQTACDAAGRRRNLRGAFVVYDAERARDMRVCLVDDILTTGTTVEECSRTLIAAGIVEVRVLSFARVREQAGPAKAGKEVSTRKKEV